MPLFKICTARQPLRANPRKAMGQHLAVQFFDDGGAPTGPGEDARDSVESKRPSEPIDYATAIPLATDFLETRLAIDASNIGIWRKPMTLRNWSSATNRPEPTQRSI